MPSEPQSSNIDHYIVWKTADKIKDFFFGSTINNDFILLLFLMGSIGILYEKVEKPILNHAIKKKDTAVKLITFYLVAQEMIKSSFEEIKKFLNFKKINKKEIDFCEILNLLFESKFNDLFQSNPYLYFKEHYVENRKIENKIFITMDAIFRLMTEDFDQSYDFSAFKEQVPDNPEASSDEYVILLLFSSWLKTCHLYEEDENKLNEENFLNKFNDFRSKYFQKPELPPHFFSKIFFPDFFKLLDQCSSIKAKIIKNYNEFYENAMNSIEIKAKTLRTMDAIFHFIMQKLDKSCSFSEFEKHIADNCTTSLDEYVILLLFISWSKTCHLYEEGESKLDEENFLNEFNNFRSRHLKKPELPSYFFKKTFFSEFFESLNRRLIDKMVILKELHDLIIKEDKDESDKQDNKQDLIFFKILEFFFGNDNNVSKSNSNLPFQERLYQRLSISAKLKALYDFISDITFNKSSLMFYEMLKLNDIRNNKTDNNEKIFKSHPYLKFQKYHDNFTQRDKESVEARRYRTIHYFFNYNIKNINSQYNFPVFKKYVSDNPENSFNEYVRLLLFISCMETCYLYNHHNGSLDQIDFLDYFNLFRSILFKIPKLQSDFFSKSFLTDFFKPLYQHLNYKMAISKNLYDSVFKETFDGKLFGNDNSDLKKILLELELDYESVNLINSVQKIYFQFKKVIEEFNNKGKDAEEAKVLRIGSIAFDTIIENFFDSYDFHKFKFYISPNSEKNVSILLEEYLMLLLFACWLSSRFLHGLYKQGMNEENFLSRFNEFRKKYFGKTNDLGSGYFKPFFFDFFHELYTWAKKLISKLILEMNQRLSESSQTIMTPTF